jgi:hypothetical protein
MNERWAYRISALFHPLLLNYTGFLLVLALVPHRSHYAAKALFLICILYLVNTVLLPLLFVMILRMRGYISSLRMDDRYERRLPYLATSVFYLGTYYLFNRLGLDTLQLSYVLASSAIIIFTALVNNLYKISIHAVSLGALTGLLLRMADLSPYDMRLLLFLFLPLAGLILSARFFSNSHSTSQLSSGLLLGFGLMYLVI